jgi:hypothetical protein
MDNSDLLITVKLTKGLEPSNNIQRFSVLE